MAREHDQLHTRSLAELYEHLASTGYIRRVLELARDEDLGTRGDVTSACCVAESQQAEAEIIARADGVISGLAAMPELLRIFAPRATMALHAHDGDVVAARSVLARVRGPMRELLALERTTLNLIGRLSGIATGTRRYVEAIGGAGRAKLYDTRKTTPGLRVLEKYAVRCGGGFCHRLGLYDAVLIKDNHLAGVTCEELAKFVSDASRRARAAGSVSCVEVEVDTLEQFGALLTLPAGTIDIVLLDNMSLAQMREAAARRDAKAPGLELEASGGVTLSTIRGIAESGVDRISVGALTHQAVSIDVAMEIQGSIR